jgi:hypothetical protein
MNGDQLQENVGMEQAPGERSVANELLEELLGRPSDPASGDGLGHSRTPQDDLDDLFAELGEQFGAEDWNNDDEAELEEEDRRPFRPDYLWDTSPDFVVDQLVTGRRVYHHVLPNQPDVRKRLVACFGRSYRAGIESKGFVLATTHGGHIHILHGCNITEGKCRCPRHWGANPRFARQYDPASLGDEDYFNFWQYLVSGPDRRILFWSNGGGHGPAYCDVGAVRSEGRAVEEKGHLHTQCQRLGLQEDRPAVHGSKTTDGDATGPKGSSLSDAVNTIWAIADAEWTSDISTLLELPSVVEHCGDIIESCEKRIMERLVNRRRNMFVSQKYWKFENYAEALEGRSPSFGYDRNKLQTRANTFHALVEWFKSQFENNWALRFLDIVRVFDKSFGKQNAIVFVGPPSCGKTWLVTMFKDIARYSGYVRNYTKGNLFCFDNALQCRLIVHDEAIFPIDAPDYIETYKQLAAGQCPTVNVKFKSGQKIADAPVFIMSNTHPLSGCANQMQYFDNVRWTVNYLSPVKGFKELTESKYGNAMALFDMYNYCLEEINNM